MPEENYSQIPNGMIEALARARLSNYETRLVFFLARKTFGFHKESDYVANSQFVGGTGIKKPHVSRAKRKLIEKKIIIKIGKGLSLNTKYGEWTVLPKEVTVTNMGNSVTSLGNNLLPEEVDTKESKETIQNKHLKSDKSQKAYKIKIIFLFASKKKFSFNDREIEQSFIRRQLRPAESLTPYSIARIEEVMNWLNENADYKWTLETVGKYIDEDLAALTKKEAYYSNMLMREKFGKWEVYCKGEWTSFYGKESEIEWRQSKSPPEKA